MEDKLNNCVCAAECRKDMRYKSCQVPHDHRVPYVIWFEDALSHFGVPTVVFDLYLLVEDIDRAAKLLIEAGWVVDMESPHKIGNAEVQFPQQGLMSPDRRTKTVILPAADWKFPCLTYPSNNRCWRQDHHANCRFQHFQVFLMHSLRAGWTVLLMMPCY